VSVRVQVGGYVGAFAYVCFLWCVSVILRLRVSGFASTSGKCLYVCE